MRESFYHLIANAMVLWSTIVRRKVEISNLAGGLVGGQGVQDVVQIKTSKAIIRYIKVLQGGEVRKGFTKTVQSCT